MNKILSLSFKRYISFRNTVSVKKIRELSSNAYDLAVIGSGPGGYVAAIKASQLGLKTVCIEKSATLGGTCLNIGCIPSKSLLHCSHHYHMLASNKMKSLGINCEKVSLNFDAMMSHKNNCVKTLTGGISALFKYNKVSRVIGHGKIVNPGKIEIIVNKTTKETIDAKNILIATGSESTEFRGIEIDEDRIISSTGALSLKSVPERMIIIGAGVIGLELGSVWSRLGTKVTCIEYLKSVGGVGIDEEVSVYLMDLLKKQGINFCLGHKVISATKTENHVDVTYQNLSTNESQSASCDILLVCVGRKPFTENLGLNDIGVRMDDKGRIIVNSKYETSVPNVYAIGDCIPGPMLAHKAEEEGIACVEGLCGRPVHMNYNSVPSVIYTSPEVAWVGISEDEAKESCIEYKVGKFPLSSNGRSRAVGDIDGFVKIITDAKSDKLLGGHIISSCAGEIINQLSMAIEYGASAEDVARSCFAHPTVAESVKEACLTAYCGKPINGI